MGRYLAICSYDGTSYYGFQKQVDGNTIQNEIENVISRILDTPTVIHSSGRTDAGVHALRQPFHFDTTKELDLDKFRYSMNCLLKDDIHIESIQKVDDNFHARINAKSKHYRYVINMGERDPFKIRYQYDLNKKLNLEDIIKASSLLIGKHNYQDFTTKEEDFENFNREIFDIKITSENGIIILDFYGSGFMRYMIRIIVGTLIAIGLGKENVDFINKHLNSKDRNIISYKAPGNGLTLVDVKY